MFKMTALRQDSIPGIRNPSRFPCRLPSAIWDTIWSARPVPDTHSVIAMTRKFLSEGMAKNRDGLGIQLRFRGWVEIQRQQKDRPFRQPVDVVVDAPHLLRNPDGQADGK